MGEYSDDMDGRAEVKIMVKEGSLKTVEHAAELLRELKPELSGLSGGKMEEAIDLMPGARERFLPRMPHLKGMVNVLGETKAVFQFKFNDLALNGETQVIVPPLSRRQD